jgi:hypothetical protein
MKWFVWVSLLLFPALSFAESYTLLPESHCSSSGEKLEFSCKDGPSFSGAELTIFKKDESWYGQENLKTLTGPKKNIFSLPLAKQNSSVMIFDYPVLYSGVATIVLIKKTGRYYFSEVSYSEPLGVQDVTVEGGRFIVGK